MTSETLSRTWNLWAARKDPYYTAEGRVLISDFLQRRLRGENLDLGCGWQSPYYNPSVGVGFSCTSLRANVNKKKVHFDLNTLASGAILPFRSRRFGSATMVSVWPYLKNAVLCLPEISRTLKIDGKVYIIGIDGYGLDEIMYGPNNSEEITSQLKDAGYSPFEEVVGEVSAFKCPCKIWSVSLNPREKENDK